jgi:multicomponent Na+:H+ antiporter subunit E
MNLLSTNLLLAIVWAALTGTYSLPALLTGLAVGFAALWVIQPLTGASNYHARVFAWIRLVAMFLYELVVSSFAVAWDVLTPRHRARPAIIDVPLDVKSDAGILLLTNLISLTPGTLSLDVSEDRSTLKVHAMFAGDPEALRHTLKTGMEAWVIAAVEGKP